MILTSLSFEAANFISRQPKDARIATDPFLFLPVHHMIIIAVNVTDAYSVAPVTYAQPVTCLISQMSVVCYLLYSLRD
jgi:hypothetical protein